MSLISKRKLRDWIFFFFCVGYRIVSKKLLYSVMDVIGAEKWRTLD